MLSPVLTLNGKYAIMGGLEPISCELMLHFAIRYLAGGSFYDVWATAIISKPSFHRLVWHIIDCINRCDALAVKLPGPNELDKVWQGFEAFSWDGVLNGCIGALVGYLQCIAAPSHKECGNVGAYFSGHYCVYGVNLQAMWLPLEKLTILLQFKRLLSKLGLKHCLLGILLQWIVLTAFQNMQSLLILVHNVTLNVVTTLIFLSQLQIQIEMAFGLLVTMWCILHTPINCKLCNIHEKNVTYLLLTPQLLH